MSHNKISSRFLIPSLPPSFPPRWFWIYPVSILLYCYSNRGVFIQKVLSAFVHIDFAATHFNLYNLWSINLEVLWFFKFIYLFITLHTVVRIWHTAANKSQDNCAMKNMKDLSNGYSGKYGLDKKKPQKKQLFLLYAKMLQNCWRNLVQVWAEPLPSFWLSAVWGYLNLGRCQVSEV